MTAFTSTASDEYHRESADRALRLDLHERNARFCELHGIISASPAAPIICTNPYTLAEAMRAVDVRREERGE